MKLAVSRKPPARGAWARPLPRTIVIPRVMTIATLADVRALLRHLPATHRERPTWRHVAAELAKAAAGADPIDVFVALQLVLSLELAYRLKPDR